MKALEKTETEEIEINEQIDYTADWPVEELEAALKKEKESGLSNISSLEDYRKKNCS